MQALSHIAQKLEQLHASGWVHRDLKPGNILRLPHIHSWTLMDFGSAGRTGTFINSTVQLLRDSLINTCRSLHGNSMESCKAPRHFHAHHFRSPM